MEGSLALLHINLEQHGTSFFYRSRVPKVATAMATRTQRTQWKAYLEVTQHECHATVCIHRSTKDTL